jgi:hypothetical protein
MKMKEPRITNDPYADADARDRWQQERANSHKKIRCCKCKHHIEDGEEYLHFGDINLCEYCISDLTKVMVY